MPAFAPAGRVSDVIRGYTSAPAGRVTEAVIMSFIGLKAIASEYSLKAGKFPSNRNILR